MPEISARVPYDPTEITPAQGVPANDEIRTHATAEDFGGNIGQALQNVGNQQEDQATKYMQMATEAKANDIIANQFAPAAAQLKQGFYQKQGIDAVNAQPQYIAGLQDLRSKYTDSASSPYERQILSGWMSRHAAQENDGASVYAGQQLTKFEDQSHNAMLSTLSSNMVGNYTQPDVVDQNMKSGEALIQKHGIDRGQSPDEIEEVQRQFRGKAAQDMVGSAVARGDITTANSIYNTYKENISGPEQMAIDRTLHTENMKQFGSNAASALLAGNPAPYAPIGTSAQVKSVVADTAQKSGVDPNQALAVASIESDFGQNAGKRGDVGQTGKGGDLPEQASNMVDALKQSKPVADNAVGRQSEPWEQYVVYQQGNSGGPALLKSANDDPTAKAVDVLSNVYDNPKDAKSAIVNNGGNASMTSGQFLDMIKSKYQLHAQHALMTIPGAQSAPVQNPVSGDQSVITSVPSQTAGGAIMAPHQEGGIAMQTAVSPTQKLLEMDKVYPDAIMRANQIPNMDQREATLSALEQQHKVYQAGAQAYSTGLVNQADKIAVDPKFTSMDQMPQELQTALMQDHPQTLAYMENRANYNLEHASGGVSKEAKEYGPQYNDVLHDIWSGKISSLSQLHDAQADGKITIAGVDRFSKELNNGNDPAGKAAETKMQANAFAIVHSQLTHGMSSDMVKMNPEIEKQISSADIALFNSIDERKSRQIPAGQYYDPANKEFIGNDVKALQVPKATALAAQISGAKQAVKTRSLGDILGDAAKYRDDPAKQAALKQEAISGGYFDPNAPQVPMSQ